MTGTPRLLTTAEVMEIFGVTDRTLRRWRRQGLLPCIKLGGSVRYRLADIDRLIGGEAAGSPGESSVEIEVGNTQQQ